MTLMSSLNAERSNTGSIDERIDGLCNVTRDVFSELDILLMASSYAKVRYVFSDQNPTSSLLTCSNDTWKPIFHLILAYGGQLPVIRGCVNKCNIACGAGKTKLGLSGDENHKATEYFSGPHLISRWPIFEYRRDLWQQAKQDNWPAAL